MAFKFRTFRIVMTLATIGLVVGGGFGVKRWLSADDATTATAASTPVASRSSVPPTADLPPLPQPGEVPFPPAKPRTVAQLQANLDAWLAANGDRAGRTKLKGTLPGQQCLTALRFKESDAIKWSDRPAQWSQLRVDFDCDGRDDEKWLLKNGNTWKRETLNPDGSVATAEYLN